MNRSETDLCLICLTNKATQKGSHFVPASIIDPCIGERDYEESFQIDIANGDIDTYFGRSNVKNNQHGIIKSKKQNHYTYDFIFCPTCENKLGELEGLISPILMDKLRNNPASYVLKSGRHDIKFKELLNIDKVAFLVFFYSIAFRFDISFRIDFQKDLLSKDESEKLRAIIQEYLYKGKIEDTELQANFFHFIVVTKNEFSKLDPTLITTSNNWDYPNIFYICQFIVFWFSADDVDKVIANPFSDYKNSMENSPTIIIASEELWTFMISKIKMFVSDFLHNVGENLSHLNNKSIEENVQEFQSVVARLKELDTSKLDLNYTHRAIDMLKQKYS
ncbi:MAG: hypothetical protein IPO78_14765 [Saprospiraceae bacterium]|nr:hypothetical protein [Saprospiraceae bacterium]